MIPIDLSESTAIIKSSNYYNNYLTAILIIPVEEPVSLATEWGCPIRKQCVAYVKSKGVNIKGNAWNIKSNSDIPIRGGGILLYSGRGHIGYVEAVVRDLIFISHQNGRLGCGMIEWEWININDPIIRGFIK